MSEVIYERVLSRDSGDGAVTEELSRTLHLMSTDKGPVDDEDFVVSIFLFYCQFLLLCNKVFTRVISFSFCIGYC